LRTIDEIVITVDSSAACGNDKSDKFVSLENRERVFQEPSRAINERFSRVTRWKRSRTTSKYRGAQTPTFLREQQSEQRCNTPSIMAFV